MPRSVLGTVSKTGGARAIRFGTPEKLCEVLDCQPGDLFAFENLAADVAAVAS
jgi:putative transcriptional regulator